jgi:hypothetical protein
MQEMTDILISGGKRNDWKDDGPWYDGTRGERIAVRISSLDTNGAYATFDCIHFVWTTETGRGNFGEFDRRTYIVGS